ncbi:MAG TPA: hypothetical protein VF215_17530, partial [Thermoanaerobaculia bacterium]
MNRKLILLACLALSTQLAADSADLQITRFITSKSTVAASEPFTVVMQWHNAGPDTAHGIVGTIGEDSGGLVITGNGSEHSVCEPTFGGDGFTCRKDLAAGADGEMIVTMLAPTDLDATQLVARGRLIADTPDPNLSDNSATATLTLKPATSTGDLSITPNEQEHRVASEAQFSVPLLVRNAGPDAATDIYVALAFTPGSRIPVTATGDGWSCGNPEDAPWNVVCRRPQIATGASTSLLVHATAPTNAGLYRMYARVAAAAGLNDPSQSNLATAVIQVGEIAVATTWTRFLVPLPPGVTPGANGAQWTTKTTALLRSQIELHPNGCEQIVVLCPTSPFLRTGIPFDLGETHLVGAGLGEFVIVRSQDAPQISINSRVWDASRIAETAGSEIPIPRDDDFTAGTIVLLGIPVAPQYRHTLRVYDLEGHGGARVAIRIFTNGETTPRTSTTATLAANPIASQFSDQLLSTHPATLQLDPAQLASLAGATSMRVEIEPLDEGS